MGEESALSDILAQLEDRHFDFVICNRPEFDEGYDISISGRVVFNNENEKNFIGRYVEESLEFKEQIR